MLRLTHRKVHDEYARLDASTYYTMLSSKETRFHPKQLPKLESVPPAGDLFVKSTSKLPAPRTLNTISHHAGFLDQLSAANKVDENATDTLGCAIAKPNASSHALSTARGHGSS